MDTIIFKTGTSAGYLAPLWKIECNDKSNGAKFTIFIITTKANIPTQNSGKASIPLIGDSFMYTETSSNKYSQNIFC